MKKYLLLTIATIMTTLIQAQPFGTALWFDGANDYVEANSVSNAVSSETGMTLEAWIYPEYYNWQNYVLTFYSADYGNRVLFGLRQGKLFALSNNGSSGDLNFTTTNLIPLNQWSHIAMTIYKNTGSLTMYLNGVVEMAYSGFSAWPASDGLFCIGQDYDASVTTDHFNGFIEDVRVWKTVRTQTQIQTNMNTSLPNPTNESNLVAYYTFDNTTSGTLSDESGHTNTGTLHFYGGGDGTSSTPYKISTGSDLVYLSQHSGDWNKYFIQTANIDFGIDETLVDWNGDGTADGIGTAGFSPIGNSTTAFAGNYDGKGFSISNLYIYRPTTDRIGLFGRIVGGTAQNIAVVYANITGQNYTGGLVGAAYETTTLVKNCRVSGSITGNQFVGGLLGDNRGGPVVQYCFSTAAVTGVAFLGGLVGANTAVDEKIPQILNSYSRGSVTRTSGTDERVGAFLGENYSGVVSKSYCTGSVFYSGTTNPVDKGFIGKILSSTESDNFIETGVSNQTTGNGATAKTSEQMKTQGTFVNWNFTNDWEIQSGSYASYPYLKSITYDLPLANPALNPIPGLTLLTVTWTGASSTDWKTIGNWNPAVVPTAAVDATISDDLINYPVVSSGTDAQVKNLTLDGTSDKQITVNYGGKLTVNGIYTAVSGAKVVVAGTTVND